MQNLFLLSKRCCHGTLPSFHLSLLLRSNGDMSILQSWDHKRNSSQKLQSSCEETDYPPRFNSVAIPNQNYIIAVGSFWLFCLYEKLFDIWFSFGCCKSSASSPVSKHNPTLVWIAALNEGTFCIFFITKLDYLFPSFLL